MIETVEELIKIYSLNKEIKENNPVYKDYAVTVFNIYGLLRNRVLNLPFPKDDVKPTGLRVIENNPKPIETKSVENKTIEQFLNHADYDKVNETPNLGNINLEEETAKIISAINERLNKQIASINIVQNAYVDGKKANTGNGNNDSNSNGSSAVNTVNISFAGNDCNQPMLNQPVKKFVENRQPSSNITNKSQEEPDFSINITPEEKVNLYMALITIVLMIAAVVGVIVFIWVLTL